MIRNASVLEVTWIIMSLVGLVFSIGNTAEALRDWQVIRRLLPPDARHLLARQAVRVEGARVFQLIAFATIGIISAALPPRPGGISTIIAGLFILVVLVLGVNSLMDFRVRQRINLLIPVAGSDGEKLERLIESTDRLERTAEHVAEDLAASITRADKAPEEIPGAGADAALRSPGMTAAEAAHADRRRDDPEP